MAVIAVHGRVLDWMASARGFKAARPPRQLQLDGGAAHTQRGGGRTRPLLTRRADWASLNGGDAARLSRLVPGEVTSFAADGAHNGVLAGCTSAVVGVACTTQELLMASSSTPTHTTCLLLSTALSGGHVVQFILIVSIEQERPDPCVREVWQVLVLSKGKNPWIHKPLETHDGVCFDHLLRLHASRSTRAHHGGRRT